MESPDIAIIGGGIVGLATAYQLTRRDPHWTVVVLEKESEVGQHQSGHNSGVLHSGIYYQPGSLKAKNCRAGKLAMETFCQEHGIPFDICGKVIVAVDEREVPVLEQIHQRGIKNNVRCELIGPARLAELEPHAAGVRALHVPETGIVDFLEVCEKLAQVVQQSGGEVRTNARVVGVHAEPGRVILRTATGEVRARAMVNCAGLFSDRIMELSNQQPEARIVPFRGEYYMLEPEAHQLCKNLIYPVPNPNFPFLGVHFTRTIHDNVECGPNAVLAGAREGYRKRDIRPRDIWQSVTYPGFLKLAARYWQVGFGEMHRSFSKRAFVTALQRLVPALRAEHLHSPRAGVRAQAIARDGTMVDDFLIQQQGPVIHVGNAPSPAATSALNIGSHIVDRIEALLT